MSWKSSGTWSQLHQRIVDLTRKTQKLDFSPIYTKEKAQLPNQTGLSFLAHPYLISDYPSLGTKQSMRVRHQAIRLPCEVVYCAHATRVSIIPCSTRVLPSNFCRSEHCASTCHTNMRYVPRW
jgi:hypothetical protein